MSTNKSKVAVIGTGKIGKVVAENLVNGNRSIIIAARDIEKAKTLSQTLGSQTKPMEIAAAIKAAEIIVMAVWFDSIKELLSEYATELQGKIIIDPSNPIIPDGKGGFNKKIGEKESAGQILAALLPKGAKLVKAFGTLAADSLSKAAHTSPANVLFYASDDNSVNDKVEELIRDSGFESLNVGGIDQSIRLEVFGELHEFGGLGKTVTLAQASEKISQHHEATTSR
jgi:predicted dinucleotide-binding enzyme